MNIEEIKMNKELLKEISKKKKEKEATNNSSIYD